MAAPAAPAAGPADGAADDAWTSLFELLPVGAYRSSPEGRQLRANQALARLNGYASEAEQLAAVRDIGAEWYVEPGRRTTFQQLMQRDGRVVGFESEVWRHKTRERIWVRENAHVVRDAAGRVRCYEGTVEEITDIVRTRDALARSEAEVRRLVAMIPGMVYRARITGGRSTYEFVSDRVREIYGVEPAEVLADGDLLRRMRHPDDAARVEAELGGPLARHESIDYALRIRRRDGATRWVQVMSRAVETAPGERVRVGVLFDVTEREESRLALERQQRLWLQALEASGDGVWDWRVADGVEILSPQCKALYGYGPDELPDTPDALDDLTHPDDKPRMAADREAHFAGRTPRYVNEHRVRCRDGSWKWILSRGLVIERGADGRPLRMIGTHTDVTAAKQAEALRVERDNAAAADQAKSEFLSRVSHELRTPLNGVLGFAQLLALEPGGLDERQRGWLEQVLASGRHLAALLEDVLDLSSLQTGRLAMLIEPVHVADVVREAWAMLAPQAAARGIRLEDHAAGRECRVLADRKRLKQIASNLLSNAVKYNHDGGWVRVDVAHRDAGPGEAPWCEFVVADGGPGLAAEQRARLFRPFDRLGAERGPVAGTGLGLALTRQLVEALGGHIHVSSEPGRGAEFRVRLRAA